MKKYFPCLLILLTLGVMINSPYPHVSLPPQQQRVGKKISAQNTYTIEDGKEFGKKGDWSKTQESVRGHCKKWQNFTLKIKNHIHSAIEGFFNPYHTGHRTQFNTRDEPVVQSFAPLPLLLYHFCTQFLLPQHIFEFLTIY